MHETTVTELFNSFFNKEPRYIRKAIVEFLLADNNQEIDFKFEEFTDFKEQGKNEDNTGTKAPDFAFEGLNSLVYLEVKINDTELQPSQSKDDENDPGCYVGMLHNSTKAHKGLFFLVPSTYKHRADIPKKARIKTWKDLDKFVRDNEYDNQILKRIIYLSSDFTISDEGKKTASDKDIQYLLYDIDYLPRIGRIHNRLSQILDKVNYKKHLNATDETVFKNYRWDPGEDNPYNNPSCIVVGKYISGSGDEANFALCVFSGLPYIYLDTTNKLQKQDNIQTLLKQGTNLYKICEIDTPIDDAVKIINKMIDEE